MYKRQVNGDVANEALDPFVTVLWNGQATIMCIDPQDPSANRGRNTQGAIIASISSCIFLLFLVLGARYFLKLRESYRPATLLLWYVHHQSELAAQQLPCGAGVPSARQPVGTGDERCLGLESTRVDEDSISSHS